ncbi:MAG: YbjP/YqhG family protein [Azoarcus sp.]|jgi:hypothetical protein|nr:YbjP/YqhG family protein [Azoarcus sp.]
MAALLLARPFAAFAAPPASAPHDPVAMIDAIYVRAAKGNGQQGSGFLFDQMPRYFSKSLLALWARADAKTAKDEPGAINGDLATGSQEPDIKSFTVKPEMREADKARVTVTFTHHDRSTPGSTVVRYALVRQAGRWKIDDISYAGDNQSQPLRGVLEEYIRMMEKP